MPTQCGMDFNGSPSGGGQGGDQIFDDVEITQDLEIQGDLTVNGTTTTINTELLLVEDPMVLVGAGNQADLNDAGLIVEYDASSSSKYAGLVRDKSDTASGKKVFKLVDNLSSQPGTTNNNTVLYNSNLTDLKARNLTGDGKVVSSRYEEASAGLGFTVQPSQVIFDGNVLVESLFDTRINNNQIRLGTNNAGSVKIGRPGILTTVDSTARFTTNVFGDIIQASRLDRETTGPLILGNTIANQVQIAGSAITTQIKGNLEIKSQIDTENFGVKLELGGANSGNVIVSQGRDFEVIDDVQVGTDPTVVSGATSYATYGSVNVFNGSASQGRMGFDVSAYGDKIAYSAPNEVSFRGRVYVRQYDTNTNTWLSYGAFISGLNANERIGDSIWLDEKNGITRIAIGAITVGAGFTRVYEYQSGSWVQLGNDIQGINAGDKEGEAVSINGNLLATVSKEHDNGTDLGMCRVFEWDGVSWTQKGQTILGPGGGWPNYHLDDCILTDNHLFISDFSTNSNTGKVDAYTFDTNSGQWVQKGQSLSGSSTYHRFGEQISAYEDDNTLRVVIGEPIDYGNASRWGFPGKAYIYDWGGTQWNLTQTLQGDTGRDGFGYSMGVFANRLVVGTRDSNYAKVYTLQSGTWTQVGNDITGQGEVGRTNILNNPVVNQQFLGNAVAIYDKTIVVSDYLSPLVINQGGTVELYQLTNIAPFSAFSISDKHRVYGTMGCTDALTAYDDLKVKQDIDVISSGSLNIGGSVATSVNISKVGDTTTVKGALKVDETINATGKMTAQNFGDDANRNLFIGEISDPAPTGTDNTCIGLNCGDDLTTANNNVLIGNNAGALLTTGGNSIGLGPNTLGTDNIGTDVVTGYSNFALGFGSLSRLTTGHDNISVGINNLFNNATGNYNVSIGSETGNPGTNPITNPSYTLRIGVYDGAQKNVITGDFNTGSLSLGQANGTSNVNILSTATNPFTVNTVNQDVKRDVYGQIWIPSDEQTSILLANNQTYDINSTTFILFGQGLTPYPFVDLSNGLQQTNPLAYHFSVTVSDAGWYEVNANMNCFPVNDDGMLLIFGLNKNGSATDFASVSLKMKTRYSNQTISCLIQCAANDILSLYLRNEGDSDTIKVKHMNMTVKRLRTSS